MKPPYTGGCQCGAVRYRIDAELKDPHLCHCRMCQKAAGNYFMPLGGLPRSALSFTRGAPAWFHSSDPVRRGFCNQCGTPLVFDVVTSDHTSVTLGSLDDPAAVRPASVYGTEALMPWLAEIAGQAGRATEAGDPEYQEELAAIRASNHQHPDHDTDAWPPEDRK